MRPERALPTLSEVLDDPISHAQLLSAWTAEHARNCAAAAGLPPPTAGARVLAETAVQTDPLHQPTTSATCAQTDAPPRTASSSAQYEPHASAAAACQTDTRGLTSSSDCTAQTDAPAASTDAACSAMPALSTSAMQTDTPQPPPTTSTGCSAVPLVVTTEVQTDRSLVARTSVSGSTQTDPIVVSRAGVSVQTDTRTSCSGSTQTDTAAVATTGTMAAPQQVSVTVQVDVSQLVAHLAVQTQTDALVAPVTADAFTEPDHALTLDECDEMSESEEGEERQALQDTVLELQNENTLLAKVRTHTHICTHTHTHRHTHKQTNTHYTHVHLNLRTTKAPTWIDVIGGHRGTVMQRAMCVCLCVADLQGSFDCGSAAAVCPGWS